MATQPQETIEVTEEVLQKYTEEGRLSSCLELSADDLKCFSETVLDGRGFYPGCIEKREESFI